MRIGIVTPTLNAERFLESTLESIWNQPRTGLVIDHVIVDGGSQDTTIKIANRYPSRVLMQKADGGMYDAINQGICEVAGDVVGYLNADDELAAGTLQVVASTFREMPDVDWLLGAIEYIDESGRFLGRMRPVRFGLRGYIGLGWSCVPQPTSWVRRSFFDRVGPFDSTYANVGDYDWYARARALTRPHISQSTLARFRIHPAQKSQDAKVMSDEGRRVQSQYGAPEPIAYLSGRMLSLRLNLRNPRWLVAKKKRRIHFGG